MASKHKHNSTTPASAPPAAGINEATGGPASDPFDPVFRNIWENSLDGMRVTDSNGIVLLVNAAYCELVRRKRDDLVGHPFWDVYAPERHDEMRRCHKEQFQARAARSHLELETVLWDERELWLEISVSCLDGGGRPPMMLSIVREITGRKQLEYQLQMTQRSVDHASQAIMWVDQNGTIRYANEASLQLFNRPRDQFVGLKVWEIDQHVKEEEWPGRWEAVKSQRNATVDSTVILPNGITVYNEIDLTYVEYHGREYVVCFVLDITQRKQTERDALLENAWLGQLFENMSLGIAMLDEEEHVLEINPAFETIFGYSRQEIAGKYVEEFLIPLERTDESRELSALAFGGGIADKESIRRCKDGSLVPVHVLGIPIRVEGRLVGIYAVYEDISRRKSVEDALRSSEERYRSLVDRMIDGVYRSTPEGRFVEVNPAMARMFGFESREEMMSVHIPTALYFSPDDRKGSLQENADVEIGVVRMKKKDGSEIWVEDHGTYVRDAQGQVIFNEGILRDITKRKQVDDLIRENEERFRTLARNAQDVVTIHDASGTILYATDSCERILGYPPADLIGHAAIEFAHPDERAFLSAAFQEILECGTDGIPTEYRFRRSDGSWSILESVGRNMLAHPGIHGIVLTSRDITERKRSEEALRESEARFRAVVEQSADGIYLIDVLSLEVVDCNAAFCRMLGYTSEEMLKLAAFNIVADNYSEINRRLSMVLTENSPLMEERMYRTKTGSTIDVLASAAVIAYGGKRLICTVVRDITERKKLERDREMLIEELQDALSNIRTLGGLVPICSNCKKIRDDKGYWNHLEKYLMEHSDVTLSHGICPDCAKKLYPEVFDK